MKLEFANFYCLHDKKLKKFKIFILDTNIFLQYYGCNADITEYKNIQNFQIQVI